MKLANVVLRFKALAEAEAEKVLASAIKKIYAQHLIPKSPLWTGAYITNFIFTRGTRNTVEQAPPVHAHTALERTYMVQAFEIGTALPMKAKYYITNVVPYGPEIEQFASPKARLGKDLVKSTELFWRGFVEEAAREHHP